MVEPFIFLYPILSGSLYLYSRESLERPIRTVAKSVFAMNGLEYFNSGWHQTRWDRGGSRGLGIVAAVRPLSPDMLASLMIFAPPEQEKKVSKGGGGEGKRAEKANTRFCNLVGGKYFWTKTITRNNRKIKIAECPIAFVE